MKKMIAMLLVLVITIACLSGLAFAAPEQVAEADAGVKVTLASGEVMWLETLTRDLFKWLSSAEVTVDSTVTLLKDIELSSEGATFLFELTYRTGMSAIVVDMNGHTITFTGSDNMFGMMYGGDVTWKNGTVNFMSTGTRVPFSISGSKAVQCDRENANIPANPKLTLENMTVYVVAEKTGRVINCFSWNTEINIKDCNLFTTATNACIDMRKSTQADNDFIFWFGEYESVVNIENSTIGSAGDYALAAVDVATFNMKNVTLNAAAGVIDAAATAVLNIEGDASETTHTTVTPDGATYTGKSFVYAVAAPVPEVPSTDVPDVEVPKTGVSIAALGILAVTSMAGVVIARKKED